MAQLVDEAAGLHLASGASWSSAEAAPGLALAELEAWIEPLRQESHRMLDNMAERLGNEPAGLSQHRVEDLTQDWPCVADRNGDRGERGHAPAPLPEAPWPNPGSVRYSRTSPKSKIISRVL